MFSWWCHFELCRLTFWFFLFFFFLLLSRAKKNENNRSTDTSGSNGSGGGGSGAVKLRQKQTTLNAAAPMDNDDDKPMRRVSYLRATANDGSGFHIDSDFDSSPVSLVPELGELDTPEAEEPVPLNKP